MGLLSRRLTAGNIALGGLLVSSLASAQEVGGVRFLITETSIVNYHIDNRDSDRLNDNYGEWLNRLNVQATRGAFTAQIRLDSAYYFAKPNPNLLGRQLADDSTALIRDRADTSGLSFEQARADFINQQVDIFGRNLSSRYVNTFYPSKMAVSYVRDGVDLTVGDFYTQLGRGLVLALRKADELATDTTLRGVKLDYRPDLGPLRFGVTLLGGYTNPLRVDEVSGRQLAQGEGAEGGWLFPLAPGPNTSSPYTPNARPTFAPDRIIGARIEQGVKELQVSFQGAYLSRPSTDFYDGTNVQPTRNVRDVVNASAAINVPDLAGHGSFYLEAGLQTFDHPFHPPNTTPSSRTSRNNLIGRLSNGSALYALLTLYQGPVTLNLEGKHYNHYYPLMASVSNEYNEFVNLQYNAVPTTEFIWSDTQFNAFNACVTGGRARVDVKARDGVLFYTSVGGYVSHSESVSTCGYEEGLDPDGNPLPYPGKTAQNRNTVVDPWVGFEWNAENNRSHVYGSVGMRFDEAGEEREYPDIAPTTTYYRENYHVRYDAVRRLAGQFSIQTAGFHRRRFKAEQRSTPWYEGENYLSLLYAPKVTVAFGYEYTTLYGDLKHFYNGQVLYRFTSDKTIRVFVGQSRPALRCVSGICRQFPAFEGAKVELVLRF